MLVEAWPYVVGRGFDDGHRAILAPAFLAENEFYLLEYASSGDTTPDGTVVAREIVGSRHSPITLLYRVVRPTADRYGLPGDQLLHDSAGRPITVFEGFVLRLPVTQARTAEATNADFEELREAAAPAYRSAWKASRGTEPERTQPIAPAPNHDSRQLTLTIRERFVVPQSPLMNTDFEEKMAHLRSDTDMDATPPTTNRGGKNAKAKYIGAIASLITAVAGLATAAAVLFGQPQSSPRATTGPVTVNVNPQLAPTHESSPTPSSTATLTDLEQSLADRVTHNNYLSNCQPSNTPSKFADFSLICSAFGIRHTEVKVSAFNGEGADGVDATPGAALRQYLNYILQSSSLTDPSGLCSGQPYAGAGTWAIKNQDIGTFICFQSGASQALIWTFCNDAWVEQNNNEQFAIIAFDGDPSSGGDLWQWWQKLPV